MRKFLFAGCGSIGRRHIQNLKGLLPDARILTYRVRKESLGEFETKYGLENFSDFSGALDQKPDAVFITNPTSLHLPLARQAAERGIPMFIEKPVSHTLEGVDEFIEICEKKKLTVLLGYKMRFHPAVLTMKKLLEEGKIGRPLSIRAHYGGCLAEWHPWEDYRKMYSARKDLGGGVVLDAIHELDYVYWLLGDVTEIQALCGQISDLEIETEDMAEILLRFKSGAFGSVHLDYVQYPESRSCQIIGTKGTIEWNTAKRSVDLYEKESKVWKKFPEPENWATNDMFVEEMRHFLNCLEGKEKPNHTLADARRVLEIAVKAKERIITHSKSGGKS